MKVSMSIIVSVYIFCFSCYCVALDNGYEMESEFQINTTTTGSQWDPRIASDGVNYFAVWKSDDGDENGVYGQRLDKFTSLSGPELLINTYTTSHQLLSSIASNSSNYLITWTSSQQDGTPGSIYARLIGTDGSVIGSEFKINTYTTATQATASAVASSSNYMVVWTSEGQDGSLYGVFGQLIDTNGTKIGSEFQVNTYTTDWQNNPRVACNGSNFLITWMSRNQDGDESGVFAQLLDNSGTKIGAEFQVNTYTTNYQTDPVIASNGSLYMVVWYNTASQDGDSYGVFGQLVDNSGSKVGSEFQVNSYTTNYQYLPSVASNGSDFLVTWTSVGQDGDAHGIFGQLFDSNGTKIGSEFQINSYTTSGQFNCCVTESNSSFIVAWTSSGQDGDVSGIFAKKLSYTGLQITQEPLPQTVHEGDKATFTVNASSHHGNVEYEWYKNGILVDNDNRLTLADVTMADNDSQIFCRVFDELESIASQTVTLTVLPNYEVPEETVVASYATGISANVAVTSDGSGYLMVWEMPITTGFNNDIAGQFFDANGSKIGSEFKANSFTPTYQTVPAVATNGDNYCIAWSSLGQDSDGYGIFAQLIDNEGTKIGSEFQVNTTEAGNQGHTAVTSDGTDYFIVWDDSANIFGQLYASNGTKTGSEIQITPTDSFSDGGAAIISSGSHYLVAWSGSTSSPSLEIFGQLLTLSGIKLGTKFQITSPTGGYHQKPDLIFIGSNYLVAWEGWASTSSQDDIYGQQINTSGSVIPPEFQINTYTTNDQEEVAIAFNGTDFLAVWQSDLQDGTPESIYGQFFDTDLNPIGTEFQINSFTTSYQSDPAVASNGTDFLVAWHSRLPSTQICMTIIRDIALVITDHPIDKTGDEYGDVQFSVTAYTRHGDLHYQWYKNDVMAGTDSNTYTISSLAMADNDATIYCVVSDDKTSMQSDTAKLTVYPIIKMMQQPASQTVYVGEPVTFSVNADSSVLLHYQWYQIKSSVHNPIGNDNDTVTITDPQLSDDHTRIYCEISNYAKSVTSDIAYLTVLEPSFVVTISGDDTVDENSGSQYTAYADYGGGSVYDVTSSADWSASPTGYGHINSSGYLWTAGVDNDQTITLHAEYNDGSETHYAYFEVLVDNIFQITGMTPLPDSILHASPANILINCNEDIKPDSVSTTTCKLIEAGNDGLFNTGDDQEMPVTPSVESSVNLLLSLGNLLLPNDQYLVQLSGITNTNDKHLDGEYLGSFPTGNGSHGGDFRAYIDISREFLSMTYNDNDTVSLTWKPFRSGLVYRIDYTDSIEPPATWAPVSPLSQWPIAGTEWTGDMVTGIEQRFYRAVGFFTSIKSINPNHASPGSGSLDIQFIGRGTQWYQNQTAVNFGNGITVTAIQVNSPSNMVVTISINILAKTGYRDITVRTGSYIEIKENGFHVD